MPRRGKQKKYGGRSGELTGVDPRRLGRGRGSGEEAERLRVAEPVRVFMVHGELARHQGFVSSGGGLLSMSDSRVSATNHPGEHGIGIVVIWGGSG